MKEIPLTKGQSTLVENADIMVKRLTAQGKLPQKMYDGDGGWDVFSALKKSITLCPGKRVCVPLGFSLKIKDNWVALIQAKSGMALKQGITTIGNVIDSTYRGECHAILINHGEESITIEPGQKVAQMLIMPCYTGKDYLIVDTLDDTARGAGGFGSTGK